MTRKSYPTAAAHPATEDLLAEHDTVLSDLDGVIYLGPTPVPGAVETLAEVRRRGLASAFVTNNAGRGATQVAEHLQALGITASPQQVVTSGDAGAAVLADELPAGSPVLVVGSESLVAAVVERGLRPASMEEVLGHSGPRGVLQGFDVELPWSRLNEATRCVHAGAVWVATNTDSTRPTHEGVLPGTGMMVHAVAVATGQHPLVAGKPHRPLYDAALERVGGNRPIFLGDRLDTDIAGARAAAMTAVHVLTGAHGRRELMSAPLDQLPDHIGWNASVLLEPPATVMVRRENGSGAQATCGDTTVTVSRHEVQSSALADSRAQLDALRCLVALRRDGVDADFTGFADRLEELP